MGANTSSDTTLMASGGVGTRSLLVAPSDAPLEQRILAATIRCVSRWGVGKTTLDDIAREAGCSRATIYRVVPGGKVSGACGGRNAAQWYRSSQLSHHASKLAVRWFTVNWNSCRSAQVRGPNVLSRISRHPAARVYRIRANPGVFPIGGEYGTEPTP